MGRGKRPREPEDLNLQPVQKQTKIGEFFSFNKRDLFNILLSNRYSPLAETAIEAEYNGMEDTTGGVGVVSLEEETSTATITTINYPELTALTVASIFKSVEKTEKAIDKLTQIVAELYEERKLSAGTTSEPVLDAEKPRYQDMPCSDSNCLQLQRQLPAVKKEAVKLPDEQRDTDQQDPTILDEEEQARITDRLENLRMRLLRTKTLQQTWDPVAKLFPPVEENSITKNGPAEPIPTPTTTDGKNIGPEGKAPRNQLGPNIRGFHDPSASFESPNTKAHRCSCQKGEKNGCVFLDAEGDLNIISSLG
ncbi:UNVERIFIED_CONTAM: hypothetical protein K2H54_058869 [Gekko kuhli]